MLRELLNDVPIAVLVLGVMALVIAAVLLAVWLLRRFVPPTREGFDAEVSSQILGSIAALFGLLLAFVIVVEFQNFEDAQGSVSGEADGLATIVRNSHAFPAADGARVRAAVGAYARAVAEDEWPRMRSGHASARASRGLDAMYGALQATERDRAARRRSTTRPSGSCPMSWWPAETVSTPCAAGCPRSWSRSWSSVPA